MVVQFPCLVCNRTVAKMQRVVQCDLYDSWVHITCNNLNLYTYWVYKSQYKSPWYCICYFWKELLYGSINDTKLRDLLHGRAIVSPNPKIISSIIKQSEYFDEEMLKRQTISFTHLMNLTLHWNASIWHYNCSGCTSTYPLYLITTISTFLYWQKHKIQAA